MDRVALLEEQARLVARLAEITRHTHYFFLSGDILLCFQELPEPNGPLGPVTDRMGFEAAGSHHVTTDKLHLIVDDAEPVPEGGDDALEFQGVGAWDGPFESHDVG